MLDEAEETVLVESEESPDDPDNPDEPDSPDEPDALDNDEAEEDEAAVVGDLLKNSKMSFASLEKCERKLNSRSDGTLSTNSSSSLTVARSAGGVTRRGWTSFVRVSAHSSVHRVDTGLCERKALQSVPATRCAHKTLYVRGILLNLRYRCRTHRRNLLADSMSTLLYRKLYRAVRNSQHITGASSLRVWIALRSRKLRKSRTNRVDTIARRLGPMLGIHECRTRCLRSIEQERESAIASKKQTREAKPTHEAVPLLNLLSLVVDESSSRVTSTISSVGIQLSS